MACCCPGAWGENTDLARFGSRKGTEGLRLDVLMNFAILRTASDRQSVVLAMAKERRAYMVDNSQVFIDPYNSQAKRDYYQLITEVTTPPGVLFDMSLSARFGSP